MATRWHARKRWLQSTSARIGLGRKSLDDVTLRVHPSGNHERTNHFGAFTVRRLVILLGVGGRVPTMRRWATLASLLVAIVMLAGVWSYAHREPSIPSNCSIAYDGEEICGLVGVPQHVATMVSAAGVDLAGFERRVGRGPEPPGRPLQPMRDTHL